MDNCLRVGIICFYLGLYLTAVDADCNAHTARVSSCVGGYAILNKDAKNDADDNSCPVDKLKTNCLSFHSLSKCIGKEGRSSGCASLVSAEFSKEGFECSYKEIAEAVGTCDASVNSVSVLTLTMTAILTSFY